MKKLHTIRYMGIKTKLLEKIVPAIQGVTPVCGTVLDLMAGSNAVSYALKEYFTVYANDVQKYSYVIGKAVIENNSELISENSAQEDLSQNIDRNILEPVFNYFEQTYSNTYFSQEQCKYIDAIRYAISKIDNEYKQDLYLFALMCAMCKVQSTTGHFAQYMPQNHPRVIPLQKTDICKEFYNNCNNYSELVFNNKPNKVFCCDYKMLFQEDIGKIDTIYLDSPYSQEQYSRFYHVLETVVKYDNPSVNFKAKYRKDRFKSNFCYKDRVKDEFENIMRHCRNNKINLVISYSNKGILKTDELEALCKEYFNKVQLKIIDYCHSTLGKGNHNLKEIILICDNKM